MMFNWPAGCHNAGMKELGVRQPRDTPPDLKLDRRRYNRCRSTHKDDAHGAVFLGLNHTIACAAIARVEGHARVSKAVQTATF